MLTYENVMHAPLDKLQTAVADWKAMVDKLDELAEAARNGMKAKADKAEWSGVTAGVGREFVAKTAKEFEDAAKQAKGVHSLLADAHTTFKAAQEQLKKIAAEAQPAGFQVDAAGRVTAIPLATEGERNAARHDPDYQQSLRTNRDAWQARVNRAVEDAADADDSLVRALQANVSDEHNFSGPTFSSLDAEQVARAAELMKKVTGEGGTARNVEALRELEDLLDDNREDPEFATDFYRSVGPEGTLEAYSKMSLDATGLGPAARDRQLMVANIQSDMGAMLGLATHKDVPNHLDAAWTTQLMKAGRKEIDVSAFAGLNTKVYGYQALGSLLRDGQYDKEFLTSVGRDMVAMDRKNPQIWEQGLPYNQDMAFNHGHEGGKGFYPLTGLMEAMSNNPDAATAFFNEPVREDSNGDGIVTSADKSVSGQHGRPQGTVDYMLDKNELEDWHDTRSGKDAESQPGRNALGHALEAAVSGQANPHESSYADKKPHTQGMVDIYERIVDKVAGKPELADGALTGSLGRMTAEYIGDINAGVGHDTDAFDKDKTQAHARFEPGSLTPFLDTMGRHEESYATVSAAQQEYTQGRLQYTAEHVPAKDGQLTESIKHVAQTDGEINGVLSGGRIDGALKDQFDKNDEYNKDLELKGSAGGFVAGSIFEAATTRVPVVGELAGWVMEETLNAKIEDAKRDPEAGSADAVREAYLAGKKDSALPIEAQIDRLTLPEGLSRDVVKDAATDASKVGYTVGLADQRHAGNNYDREEKK
ncbi:DUF6571 family protein [Streptomyces subrutilus]|uniref:DUF6571 family protein n=1 Tax=Streptomyces subrutilus TaxID=36818 RepID=UPI0033CD4E4F